jgi:hypothetical protein
MPILAILITFCCTIRVGGFCLRCPSLMLLRRRRGCLCRLSFAASHNLRLDGKNLLLQLTSSNVQESTRDNDKTLTPPSPIISKFDLLYSHAIKSPITTSASAVARRSRETKLYSTPRSPISVCFTNQILPYNFLSFSLPNRGAHESSGGACRTWQGSITCFAEDCRPIPQASTATSG